MRPFANFRFASAAVAAFAALAAMLAVPAGAATDYPTRVVSIVVPFPPGGGVDALARVVAQKLTEQLKQQFVVENRGGAGGTLGTNIAARAAPDGYTLLLGHTGTMAINPTLYVNLKIEPQKQFVPIGMVGELPVALIAHPTFPAKTVADFIKIAKEKGTALSVGTSAVGTGGYLTAQLFKSQTGLEFTIIPYKGTGPLMNDLLGNHVPVVFGVLPPALGNIQAGKLTGIAVTSKKRFSLLPDVPTADQTGMPGFEAVLTYGLLAPAGTPKEIVDKLSAELRKLVALDDVKKQINNAGGDPLVSTSAEYAAVLDKEGKMWGDLVKKLNLKVE
jgi:tripartite-type tricarboxylate transporter receptor subunit TctC